MLLLFNNVAILLGHPQMDAQAKVALELRHSLWWRPR
jgi:hypothetical protein